MSVLLEERLHDGRIALFTLNRPQVMNAFNTELGVALNVALERVQSNPVVRVVVFTGAGDRAFCTGADLKERNGMTDKQWFRQHRLFQEVHRKVRTCPKPVIAAVNGYALGGGCELAMSGDFIYASVTARFGLPEVTRGIIPGVGGTQVIGRFLPRGRALELLMTGDAITAEEAYRYGMVNRVTEPGALIDETLAAAARIADNAPLAVRMAKKAFRMGVDLPLEEGVEWALECYNRTVVHPDREEGVRAFNERRKPRFMDVY
ncbi:MAG: enoyl-CoA hydratase/isomerase family protein [Alicyclobacillus macrosporangiidus]|uniref:enoyl-CoA hydratase/isomerase family protein n=1 Tax=Alicyclobacillus macrosporangiidus TaxID=392015 RepID=UPI0026EB317E|nr:enoyl-CoA hydratase-related protein [Alicyclobacillus macrosporangiidus]MCL6598257.1 enoyl-CoA hydratase/isomerase family protein [Alicyclobacillus macrosporangiidus]